MKNRDVKIWSYKPGSRGARLLADNLDCKIIKHEGSKFVGGKDKVVINWGSSKLPDEVKKCHIINNEKNVAAIINRQDMLKRVGTAFDVPVFTVDEGEAQNWIEAGASVIRSENVYTWDVKPDAVLRLHNVGGLPVYVQFKEGKQVELPQGTKNMIKRTVEDLRGFLGLDFCAVTIGWCEFGSRAYILNVNTAPELDNVLASLYANALNVLMENR